MKLSRGWTIRTVVLACVGFGVLAPGAAAVAAPAAGPCGSSAITVVVDNAAFAGAPSGYRCVPGPSASATTAGGSGSPASPSRSGTGGTALGLMQRAGVAPMLGTLKGKSGPDARYLCRIGQRPSSNADPCTAFRSQGWTFWVAGTSATKWGYASKGVTAYRPRPGEMIGFSYGSFDKPKMSPTVTAVRSGSVPRLAPGAGTTKAAATSNPARGGSPTGTIAAIFVIAVVVIVAGCVYFRRRNRS